jgi:Tfp pilus assembly PilM family ATPase
MPLAMLSKTVTVSPIGLDIGMTATRCIQLRRTADRWEIVAAISWPNRRTEDGSHIQSCGERLRQSIRHREFLRKDVVAGLSPPDVELHALEIPRNNRQEDAQVESAARWEIERLSKIAEGSAQTAQWWLPRSRTARTTALGVATRAELVNQIWQVCRSAGAECIAVDVSACALCRSAALLRRPKRDEIWGILDLGERDGRLVLCLDDVPVLARSLNAGGKEWTHKIAESLKVSEDSAVVHKCDHGISASAGPADPAPSLPNSTAAGLPAGATVLADIIGKVLGPEIERVAAEIERSYEYVMQCYPDRHAGHLMLAGAASALKNLHHCLARRLGIEVNTAESFRNAPESRLTIGTAADRLREPLGAYLNAVGLAVFQEGGA